MMAPELPEQARPRPVDVEEVDFRPRPRPATAAETVVSRGDPATAYTRAVEEMLVARKALADTRRPGLVQFFRKVASLVDVRPLGLGYEAAGPDGVMLTLTHVREIRGDLTAELTVARFGEHLYRSRVNLSSGQARVSTARLLAAHPFGREISEEEGGPWPAPDWRELLEQTAIGVLDLQREGEPIEQVGQLPMAERPPRVIDPYLPAAVTLLWAPQGTGKSTLAVAVAVTLQEVVEVIPGWVPVSGCNVLILDWEAGPQEWNDRIARVAAGIGIEPPSIAYRRMRHPLADQVEQLAVELDRRDIGFVIVDSYEKAAGAGDAGASYEDKANRMFTALDRLARPALVLDHVAGEDVKGGVSRIHVKSIGSVLKGAWARATYDLKRDPELSSDARTELVLHNVKLNDAAKLRPYEFAVVSDGDRGPITFQRGNLTSPQLLASLPQHEQMRRHLVSGAKSTKELAELLGTTEGAIRSLVSRHSRTFQTLPGIGVTLVAQEAESA